MFEWLRRLWKLMELGFARNTYIELYTQGIISYKEMTARLDELDAVE